MATIGNGRQPTGELPDVDGALVESMREWRRHFHANPELGFEEHETTAYIRGLLEEWGVPYDEPLSTATVGHIRGRQPGPCLVIRADIDALPIAEENAELPYVSTRSGTSHACGHDAHTAILLALAKVLSSERESLTGEYRLLFQPAEELAPGGAKRLVDLGVLDGASAVIGLHVNSSMEAGVIGLTAGPMMASEDRFDIRIIGSGGHANSPHETIDALVIAAGLVMQLQTVVSRRIDPLTPAVLTVGTLNAGEVYNAIPGEARLTGTVRTMTPAARDLVQQELLHLVETYAEAHRARAEVTYIRSAPPTINDAGMVEFVRSAAETAAGAANVLSVPPIMGAEDFAFYGEILPAVFIWVGSGGSDSPPHHHPRFNLDEAALPVALKYFYAVVRKWSDMADMSEISPGRLPGGHHPSTTAQATSI